jgi:hypothetical protein
MITMRKICILLVLIILTSLGCTDENVRPSDDSLMADEAYDHINAVKEAYEGKSEHIIKHLVPELSEDIIKELSFEKCELFFEKRLIRITKSSVIINLNWQGSWWIEKDRKIENRGVADFILNKEKLILVKINGDNPFSIPSFKSY